MGLRDLKTAAGRAVNYRFQVSRGEHVVTIPVLAGIGRANRDAHEEHLYHTLEKLHAIGACNLLVDIGVNIGQTLIKHLLVTGRQTRYIGFEPNARAATYVDEIIHCNDLTNAQVVPIALGAECKLTSLYLSAPDSADPAASINENFRDAAFYGAKKLVPVFEADAALQALEVTERNFTVKIDTEGSELDVVLGMQGTLRELRPFVVMEILPPAGFSDAVNKFRLVQAQQLKDTMSGLRYLLTRIDTSGEFHRDSAAVGPLTHDYLFIPQECAARLIVH